MSSMLADNSKRVIHPNSLKNLERTKFKKGVKPPGAGRPKGVPDYKSVFNKYLKTKRPTKLPDGTTEPRAILEGIVLSALAKASKGDVKAMEFVFNRTFGKEADKMELTGKDGNSLQIEHSRRLQDADQRIVDAFRVGSEHIVPKPTEE